MAITREFRCTFHELEFESTQERPACPCGCAPEFVVQEFRTPPRIRHANTSVTDMLSRELAQNYNLTDMRNDKDGTSVMSNTSIKSGGARIIADESRPYWSNHFQVQPGWAQRQEATPAFKPPANWTCAATPVKAIQDGARNYLKKATAYVGPKR
jgi:hypothetical protein